MQQFLDAIRAALAAASGLSADEIKLERPRDPKLGDAAFPCFPLAKALKQAPPAIAAKLALAVNESLEGVTATATGPYLNFVVDRALLARTIVEEVRASGSAYGSSDEVRGQTIVIDFSSPNIAKPMSVGHLRSTVIGAALQRIFDTLGYRTVGINHIGDWGSQFGKLVAAVNRWGETVDLEGEPIKALLALYVRFHEEVEQDPTLEEEGREAFRQLESGQENAVRATWRKLTDLSLAEFQKIYTRLGVRFDLVRGEAFYESHLAAAIQRIVASGVTVESEGALVVHLDQFGEHVPPCLLRKTDGTTLYATRDLAAAFHRYEEFHFARCLYVVGADQRLHFQQLKWVLQRMQLPWEPRVQHVDFGMLRLPEGKMSTRLGRVVFLEDVLDRARDEAARVIAEKNPALAGASEVAEAVGVGAVVFNDLKRERVKDVEFVWEEVLSFEGDTGPYVQYTHARLASIERKAAETIESSAAPDWAVLEPAAALLVTLGRYRDVLRGAAERAEPSEVTGYLLGLAREVNSWVAKERVLGQDPAVTAARLALVAAARQVLANGLGILGVAALSEM
jgi:arginyl-tRNA synthetase